MGNKYIQKPGRLDIVAAQSDAFSVLLDFDIDTTGYTWAAKVDENDGTTTTITVTSSTDGSGQETLTLASTDLADISLGEHNWELRRTDAGSQRRYLAGKFTVIKYYE